MRINCVFVSDCNYPVNYRGWFCCGSTSLPEVSENGTLSSATDVIPVTSAASVSPFMAVTVADAAVPVDVRQEDGLLTSMSDLHWFAPRLYSWLGRRDSLLLIKAFLSFSHEPFLPPPPPSSPPSEMTPVPAVGPGAPSPFTYTWRRLLLSHHTPSQRL